MFAGMGSQPARLARSRPAWRALASCLARFPPHTGQSCSHARSPGACPPPHRRPGQSATQKRSAYTAYQRAKAWRAGLAHGTQTAAKPPPPAWAKPASSSAISASAPSLFTVHTADDCWPAIGRIAGCGRAKNIRARHHRAVGRAPWQTIAVRPKSSERANAGHAPHAGKPAVSSSHHQRR